nr:unnamed protein product [Naegleria fowleri]
MSKQPHQQPADKSVGMRLFSQNESKAWAEKFFLLYGPVWMLYFTYLIYNEIYEGASRMEWTMYGVIMAVPCVLYPLLFPGKADRNLPITQRYWFKCNLWVFIFNFVGNYFWTHYFYNLLGASYTMDTHRINNVPYLMFLATQAYFTFYFSLSNVLLRIIYTSWRNPSIARFLFVSAFIFAFSYFTAFMETFTIQYFKYYTFKNRDLMYKVGSIVYGIYFIVGFPMYYRVDEEETKKKYSTFKVCVESLASCMLVTILLDFWRLFVGGIVDDIPQCVPWM